MEKISGYSGYIIFFAVLELFAIIGARDDTSRPCELKPSIKEGPNYFRRLTPWGKWLDMPCARGTYFIQSRCGCGFMPPENLPKVVTKPTTQPTETTRIKVTTATPVFTTPKATDRITNSSTVKPSTTRISTSTTITSSTLPTSKSTTIKRTNPSTTTEAVKKTSKSTTVRITTLETTVGTRKNETSTTTKSTHLSTTASTIKEHRPSTATTANMSTTISTQPTLSDKTTGNTTLKPASAFVETTAKLSTPSTNTKGNRKLITSTARPVTMTTVKREASVKASSVSTAITTKQPVKSDATTGSPTIHLPTTRKSTTAGTTTTPPITNNKSTKSVTNGSTELNTFLRTSKGGNIVTSNGTASPTTVGATDQTVNNSTNQTTGITRRTTQEVLSTAGNTIPSKFSSVTLPSTPTVSKGITTGNTTLPTQTTNAGSTVPVIKNGDNVTLSRNVTGRTINPVTSTTVGVADAGAGVITGNVTIYTSTQPTIGSNSSMTTKVPQPTPSSQLNTTTSPGNSTTANPCKLLEVQEDKYSYLEFINNDIGWIQFQCPSGKEFNVGMCGCIYPGELVTTTKPTTSKSATTPTITEDNSDCPYKKEGRVSFKEYIKQLESWVYSECADGYIFSQTKCGCVLEGSVHDDEIDNVPVTKVPIANRTTESIILTTITVPDDCPYIASGEASFREYVEAVKSWVYADCPDGQIFSQKQCICISKDCPYKADGGTSFRKYIEAIGEWVHAECTEGHVFSHSVCNCVPADSDIGGTDTRRATTPEPIRSTAPVVTNPNCKFVPEETGYREYIPEISQWVSYACPTNNVFDVQRCACVNRDCPYEGTGIALYREYVERIDQWVYYECPHGQIFDNNKCMCVKDGSIEDKGGDPETKTKAPTQQPISLVTSADCPYAADGDGYREYIPDIQQWVMYDCPSGHKFNAGRCMCVNKYCNYEKADDRLYREYIDQLKDWVYYECSDGQIFNTDKCSCGPKINDTENIDDNAVGTRAPSPTTTTLTSVTNPDCEFEAAANSYRKFVVEIGQWVTYECLQGQSFDVRLCSCTENDNRVIQSSAAPKDKVTTTIRPSRVSSTPSTTKPTTAPSPSKVVCNSRPSDMGKDQYLLTVPGWGEILYSCNSGQIYSQEACDCINKEITTTTMRTTTKKRITFINPGCALMPSSLGPDHFKMQISGFGWVQFSCPSGEVFMYEKCSCEIVL